MERRSGVTYTMFAVAIALVVAALAVMPRRPRPAVAALPPPPSVVPPPVVAPPPPSPQDPPPAAAERPRIEVVFALDTTSSMTGLIDGAKRKIWSIADFISSAQPRPDLRVGLVAYRDKGDAYVTRFYDLSSDLDAVSQHLASFRAEGGGDEPEHVSRALYDAVERPQWSTGDKVVRLIYLVGDAPPHTDYHDGYDYRTEALRAAKRGIHVNTIRCGDSDETGRVWAEIARLGGGDYASIEQGGGVAEVATPYDDKLAELNRRLAGTALGWGTTARKSVVAAKVSAAVAAPAPMAADRAGYFARNKAAVSGDGDLLTDVEKGMAHLGAIRTEELPAEMQAMSSAAQKEYVAAKQAERAKILTEIAGASTARSDYLKTVAKKSSGRPEGFDARVRKTLAREASGVASFAE